MVKNKKFILFIEQSEITLSTTEGSNKISLEEWVHVALVLDPSKNFVKIYMDSFLSYEGKYDKFDPTPPSSMQVGSDNDGLEFTEFRMWKKVVDDNVIRENLKTPLEMVH